MYLCFVKCVSKLFDIFALRR